MRNKPFGSIQRALIALMLLSATGWCQVPVISGLVNPASYQATAGGNPGYIVTIFGTNLATTTSAAQSIPLPLEIGGTSVMLGGVPAPLFYVSPTQINLQIPNPASGAFVVSTPAGSSAPFTAAPNVSVPGGIFTVNSSGCGQGAVLNVGSDGSLSANNSENSASPGDWISIFGAGLALSFRPINSPAPADPPVGGILPNAVTFDLAGLVYSSWSGLAPGLVGVDQVNVAIPASVREGCAVPLQDLYNYPQGITPPVTLAIRRGGGSCVDPPEAGFGKITWQ